jgi:hypothetical protein
MSIYGIQSLPLEMKQSLCTLVSFGEISGLCQNNLCVCTHNYMHYALSTVSIQYVKRFKEFLQNNAMHIARGLYA